VAYFSDPAHITSNLRGEAASGQTPIPMLTPHGVMEPRAWWPMGCFAKAHLRSKWALHGVNNLLTTLHWGSQWRDNLNRKTKTEGCVPSTWMTHTIEK